MNTFSNETFNMVGMKRILIEFLGTFGLVYAACWSVIYCDLNELSRVGYGFSSALILACLMYFFVPATGGQFNPAITSALFAIQKIDIPTAVWFICAQFLGGLCGAGFIFLEITPLLYGKINDKSTLGIALPGKKDYDASPFWCEFIGTFLLMWVYTALIVDGKKRQSEAIGAAAFAISYFVILVTLGEVSGGSFNPARALGPTFVTGSVGMLALAQIVAPVLGAIVSAFTYKALFLEPGEHEPLLQTEKESTNPTEPQAENELLNTSGNKFEINPKS
jgi:aquaporin Z